jgi:hypothetical protein
MWSEMRRVCSTPWMRIGKRSTWLRELGFAEPVYDGRELAGRCGEIEEHIARRMMCRVDLFELGRERLVHHRDIVRKLLLLSAARAAAADGEIPCFGC